MHVPGQHAIFENRYDAGRQLAAKLAEYKGQPAVVLAIPNGGVPVALGVALALEADLDVVISRKIPLPLSPEAGFGAVADDGTTILNADVVSKVGLTPPQINYQVNKVRADIRQRSLLYLKDKPPSVLAGKTAIIIDDGLASGYTMMAAVESVRHRRPRAVVVAVPVASEDALQRLEKVANRVVACAVGTTADFYVSDFYRYWNEINDSEVLNCLKEWRMRRFQKNIETQGKSG